MDSYIATAYVLAVAARDYLPMIEYLQKMSYIAFSNSLQGFHFLATLYLVFALLSSAWYVVRVRTWPSADGNLLRDEPRSSSNAAYWAKQRVYTPKYLYSYSVNGRSFEGSEVSLWRNVSFSLGYNAVSVLPSQVRPDPSGKIRVYFNPRRPQNSLLLKPGRASIVVLWLLSLVAASFYIWRW